MAKSDASQIDELVNEIPVPRGEPQPLEKQEAVHAAGYNPRAVLQPGRPFQSENNLMGELDRLINDLFNAGFKDVAGEMEHLKVKMGDLVSHIMIAEKNANELVKPYYTKLLSFFRK